MIQHIHSDTDGPHLYASRFIPDELAELPWGDAQFNCLVCQLDPKQIREIGIPLAEWLVRANTDFIWTAGTEAKWLHDLVDDTSVKVGRQPAVGDGSPMTAWDEDAESFSELCKLFECGVPGGNGEHNLAVIIGSTADLESFVEQMRAHMATRSRT